MNLKLLVSAFIYISVVIGIFIATWFDTKLFRNPLTKGKVITEFPDNPQEISNQDLYHKFLMQNLYEASFLLIGLTAGLIIGVWK